MDRGRIGQVVDDAVMSLPHDDVWAVAHDLLFPLGRYVHPTRRFRVLSSPPTVVWDDTPTPDDRFAVDNHFPQLVLVHRVLAVPVVLPLVVVWQYVMRFSRPL
jgi:hypothetical protein